MPEVASRRRALRVRLPALLTGTRRGKSLDACKRGRADTPGVDRQPGFLLTLGRDARRRAILAPAAVAFIPVVALAFLLLVQQADVERSQVVRSRVDATKSVAATADTFVEGKLSMLSAFARMPQIGAKPSGAEFSALLQPTLSDDVNWVTFGLSSSDGWNISSFTTASHTVNIADRDYFQNALRTGKPAVGSAVIARGTLGAATVILAVPIEFLDGTRGVLSGALSLDRLATVLASAVAESPAQLEVVDGAGQVFIRPNPLRIPFAPATGRPEVDAVRSGHQGSLVTRANGDEVLSAYAPAPISGWGVIRTEPTASLFAPIDQQLRLGIASTAVAAIVALAIGWALTGRLDRAQRRAEVEHRRLEDIFRQVPARVAVMRGPELRFTYVNPAQLATLGQIAADVIGHTLAELYPTESQVGAVLRRVYETGEPFVATAAKFAAREPGGGFRDAYYDAVALPTRDAEGAIDGVMYHATEVTELVVARTAAERALGLRDEFLAIATHELRTPLTALRGFSQLARRAVGRSDPATARALERVDEQAERLVRLSTRLLDMARLEAGRLPVERDRVDLCALVARVVERYADASPQHAILFETCPPIEVVGDEVRLEEVFTNLLSNAVKYTPDGGPIAITAQVDRGTACIAVSDHGIGVPPEARDRLFERFSRAHSAQFGGVGLGLYVSRQIVELHEGSIRFKPGADNGSVFTVCLPALSVAASAEAH